MLVRVIAPSVPVIAAAVVHIFYLVWILRKIAQPVAWILIRPRGCTSYEKEKWLFPNSACICLCLRSTFAFPGVHSEKLCGIGS